VRNFDGDLDDYRALLAERARPAERAETANSRREDRRDRAEARAAVAPLRRAAKDAEARIARLADERAAIEKKLTDPALYAPGRGDEITEAQFRLAALKRDIAAAEEAWLAAAEALEAAS